MTLSQRKNKLIKKTLFLNIFFLILCIFFIGCDGKKNEKNGLNISFPNIFPLNNSGTNVEFKRYYEDKDTHLNSANTPISGKISLNSNFTLNQRDPFPITSTGTSFYHQTVEIDEPTTIEGDAIFAISCVLKGELFNAAIQALNLVFFDDNFGDDEDNEEDNSAPLKLAAMTYQAQLFRDCDAEGKLAYRFSDESFEAIEDNGLRTSEATTTLSGGRNITENTFIGMIEKIDSSTEESPGALASQVKMVNDQTKTNNEVTEGVPTKTEVNIIRNFTHGDHKIIRGSTSMFLVPNENETTVSATERFLVVEATDANDDDKIYHVLHIARYLSGTFMQATIYTKPNVGTSIRYKRCNEASFSISGLDSYTCDSDGITEDIKYYNPDGTSSTTITDSNFNLDSTANELFDFFNLTENTPFKDATGFEQEIESKI